MEWRSVHGRTCISIIRVRAGTLLNIFHPARRNTRSLHLAIRCRQTAGSSAALALLASVGMTEFCWTSATQPSSGLVDGAFFFCGSVAAKELGQVLGEGGAREDHVASDFMGFLFQVALHVREKADH
jgi:hypothetical protein